MPDRLIGRDCPDISGLLKDFQAYWAGNSADMSNMLGYLECDAQLALFGYMQKAYNGKVQTVKQFQPGSGFVDICVIAGDRKFPLELKIQSKQYSESKSIEQLKRYMGTCLSSEGWLVVFDRDSKKPWAKKPAWKTKELPDGLKVHVVGC